MTKLKGHLPVILAGLVVGIASVVLVALGNPVNMGFCIACFLRDIAGGVGMHRAAIVQYIRPEIIGLVLGAMIMALAGKEFKVRGGSSPMTRFVLGFCVMVGALMFLGCPLRMVIRLGGGDGNAILGLIGFIIGIFVGTLFLKAGFSLKKSQPQPKIEGVLMPAVNVGLLILVIAAPAFIFFSTEGPGSMRAPIAAALIAGLVVGAIAQRSRLCMAGGIRDAMMLKDFHLLMGFVAIFVAVLGMVVGAAFCHNFGLASSTDGPSFAGKVAVIIGLVLVCAIGAGNTKKA